MRQHPWIIGNRLEPKTGCPKQRVSCSDREDQLLEIELLERQTDHVFGLCQPAQHEIELTQPQLIEQMRIAAHDDAYIRMGRRLLEQTNNFRHHRRGDIRQDANGHGEAAGRSRKLDAVDPLPQRRHAGGRMLQEHFAEARQHHAFLVAQEELDAEGVLQLSQCLRERRLGDRQRVGGGTDAAQLGDGEKTLKVTKTDADFAHAPACR